MSNSSDTDIELAPLLAQPSMFSIEALARLDSEMAAAEVNTAHLSKLTAETMCLEIQGRLNRMKELSSNMPQGWPEFATLAASIRGYAFNAFHICHVIAQKQYGSTSTASRTPLVARTIDDLL